MEVDDQAELWIAGKKVGDFNHPGSTKKWNQKVEAEKWYDFRLVLREGGGDAKAILYWQSEKTPREIIAPQHFQAFAPQNANQGDSQLTQYKVAGPGNRPRTATLDTTDGGSVLKTPGAKFPRGFTASLFQKIRLLTSPTFCAITASKFRSL